MSDQKSKNKKVIQSFGLDDLKEQDTPVSKNGSASLWDIGSDVLCVELHGMKGSLDPSSIAMLNEAMDTIQSADNGFKSLVIHSEKENFAVGANLGLLSFAANSAQWDTIEDMIFEGQVDLLRFLNYVKGKY